LSVPVAVVTGAAGFIGTALRALLRSNGYEVRGLDLRPASDVSVADLSTPGTWADVIAGAHLVVHTAARVGEQGPWQEFWRANVETTRNVLAACTRARVGRVVHLSSIVVHGTTFQDGVDETAPVRPTGSPYTDTKIVSEYLALAAHARGDVPVTVIRPGDVYGPGSPQWTERPLRLLRRRTFALYRGGRGILSPVHVQDLVEAVYAAGTHPAGAGRVFHVTGGVGVSAREFFGYYADALGVRLRSAPPGTLRAVAALAPVLARLGVEPPLTKHTLEYVTHPGTYSIDAIATAVGWRPRIPFPDGM
jgi:2-alkyl-3-oxoalkanoate reductase